VALICDTGPLDAAIDETEGDHESWAALLNVSAEPRLLPAPVLVELERLIANRLQSLAST